ncbi:prospero homeobox protein 2 [Aplochiton taeniatus]
MNLSLPDQTSESCLEQDKPELLIPCFRRSMYDEPLTSYSNGSIISQLLRKTLHNKRALQESSHFFLPPPAVSSSTMADSSHLEDRSSTSSRDSNAAISPGGHLPTGASSEGERPPTDHHLQAKRARVENIIRGMASSPNGSRLHAEMGGAPSGTSRTVNNNNNNNINDHSINNVNDHSINTVNNHNDHSSSGSKEEECLKLREQLQSMQRLLRQLQDKFLQVYHHDNQPADGDETASAATEQDEEDEEDEEVGLRRGGAVGYEEEEEGRRRRAEREGQELQERLKSELSRAVTESVDKVFEKLCSSGQLSLLPQPCGSSTPDQGLPERGSQWPASVSEPLPHLSGDTPPVKPSRPPTVDYYESAEAQSPPDQTEALSLVVRKPPLTPLSSASQAVKRPYPLHHQSPFQFNYTAPLHDSQILEHLLKFGPHANFGGLPFPTPSLDRASPDSVDLPWDAIALRSKVAPHHQRGSVLGPVTVDRLCLPHVKMECGDLQGLAERNPYMSLNISFTLHNGLSEGLTPNHLKKAKLMFFYTRYPSSNVLKTYFPDVKFNRCITSQLIKWFSNFREFYYIQMEKFARQAIVDGVTDIKDVNIGRDSELFRALNMHYNKANDFQVPDRFLEVSEITLQEFYNAISTAKDSDPSWKKAIYKVICKLDSDVPEEFKSSSYL